MAAAGGVLMTLALIGSFSSLAVRYRAACPVERLHREALLYTIGEGTNDINRLVIARRLGGEEEMAYLGLAP